MAYWAPTAINASQYAPQGDSGDDRQLDGALGRRPGLLAAQAADDPDSYLAVLARLDVYVPRRELDGPLLAAVLRRRLREIAAAGHLGELRSLPSARLRPDPQCRASWMLIALGHLAGLRVRPQKQPPPVLEDGMLDESAVNHLLIAAVTSHDYWPSKGGVVED